MIRKIYKMNATVVLFLKVGSDFIFLNMHCLAILGVAPVTELFNKLLIISINNFFYFLHIHKDGSI
jgi:hypothetical protein